MIIFFWISFNAIKETGRQLGKPAQTKGRILTQPPNKGIGGWRSGGKVILASCRKVVLTTLPRDWELEASQHSDWTAPGSKGETGAVSRCAPDKAELKRELAVIREILKGLVKFQ